MTREALQAQWQELRGKFREHWGRFTDAEVQRLHGRSDELIGKIQERYARSRSEAERDLDGWLATL